MADVTVSGVEVRDGTLHITGTNFTQTTTTVLINDESVPFEFVSATELTAEAPPDGGTVVVEKGGVQSDPQTIDASEQSEQSEQSSSGSPAQGSSDVAPGELDQAANAGAAEKATPQNPKTEVTPEVRGEHVPYQNFREAVHQSGVTRVEEDLGIGVRDPYPTGNPRPQADIDAEVRGVPIKEKDDGSSAV